MNSPRSSRRGDQIPVDVKSALLAGALTGSCGLVVGGIAGITRSRTPILFALASGVQWFGLGSIYWGSRAFIMRAWCPYKGSPHEKILSSGTAGAIAGGVGGLIFRGRRNVIPGMIMFSIIGAAGQAIYNTADARHTDQSTDRQSEGFGRRVANSRWSPIKVLNDDEYATIVKERILRLDVEIALTQDQIGDLQSKAQSEAQSNTGNSKNAS